LAAALNCFKQAAFTSCSSGELDIRIWRERISAMMMRLWSTTLLLSTAFLSAAISSGEDAATLSKEDARLNKAYQARVAQLRSDPAALAALRKEERSWIVQRDQQCGKDVACLTQSTSAHADYFETQVQQNDTTAKLPGSMPAELLGAWTIRKILPTQTISCWDEKQARGLIGTELEYKPDSLRWKTTNVRYLSSTVTTVKAEEFAADNSGSQSSVTFKDLGITAPQVKQIAIKHPDVTIDDGSKGGTTEMPGDEVMLKSPQALVFSVCNVYFEADRK
jgi:hypothetical protein